MTWATEDGHVDDVKCERNERMRQTQKKLMHPCIYNEQCGCRASVGVVERIIYTIYATLHLRHYRL